jgi:hypothetical protein
LDDKKNLVTMQGLVDDLSLEEEMKELEIKPSPIIFEQKEIPFQQFKGKPGHLFLILNSLKKGQENPLFYLLVVI